jgi:uncharacterized glyoxalase superfamily protein PhnB
MDVKVIRNRSAPIATIVPILIYEDVGGAIDFLCGAFGFAERLRFVGRDGKISHAQLGIAEGSVMLGMQSGEFRRPRPNEINQYVHVRVEEIDVHFERSKKFGARIITPPAGTLLGERQYTAEDPAGHRWTFSQSVADVAPEDWGAIPADS